MDAPQLPLRDRIAAALRAARLGRPAALLLAAAAVVVAGLFLAPSLSSPSDGPGGDAGAAPSYPPRAGIAASATILPRLIALMAGEPNAPASASITGDEAAITETTIGKAAVRCTLSAATGDRPSFGDGDLAQVAASPWAMAYDVRCEMGGVTLSAVEMGGPAVSAAAGAMAVAGTPWAAGAAPRSAGSIGTSSASFGVVSAARDSGFAVSIPKMAADAKGVIAFTIIVSLPDPAAAPASPSAAPSATTAP